MKSRKITEFVSNITKINYFEFFFFLVEKHIKVFHTLPLELKFFSTFFFYFFVVWENVYRRPIYLSKHLVWLLVFFCSLLWTSIFLDKRKNKVKLWLFVTAGTLQLIYLFFYFFGNFSWVSSVVHPFIFSFSFQCTLCLSPPAWIICLFVVYKKCNARTQRHRFFDTSKIQAISRWQIVWLTENR